MNHACRYALVRFMPYAQTGEFANVGVVLMSQSARFFGCRMLDRVGRITAFFDELDVGVYKRARDTFRDEITRVGEMAQRAFIGAVNGPSIDFANFAFDEIVKPRQAIIYADTHRAVLANDPAEKLNELYEHYVGRSFVTPVYQERIVEQRVRSILRAADLQIAYQARVLGTGYKAKLPFVRVNEDGVAVKLIKPLDLGQDDPTRLYDHGWEWVGRVKKLQRDGELRGDALFAVRPPQQNFGASASAFADLKQEFERAGITTSNDDDREKILEFATSD